MYWNYRIMQYPDGECGIHEVYYDDDGNVESWTQNAVPVEGDDVLVILEMMRQDVEAHPEILQCDSKVTAFDVPITEAKGGR